MKKIIIAILITAELTSWATREYMVQTARPDKPCTITWSCDVHEYKQPKRFQRGASTVGRSPGADDGRPERTST